jgi:hypothetical protein
VEHHRCTLNMIGGFPVIVDIGLDDETLVCAFKVWLEAVRKKSGKRAKLLSERDFQRWRDLQILAVFDLDLWGKLNKIKYTDHLIAKTLWPDFEVYEQYFDPVDRLRKTARPKVIEIIRAHTIRQLASQIRLSNFA